MRRAHGVVPPEEKLPALAAPWVRGPEWDTRGLHQTGWVLLPLRIFLGVTFVFASLQKLANPSFFDASSPGSVQAQMHAVAPASPIGPLVDLSLHGGWLVGLMIALGELAVGIGTLLGLRARLAATGGMLLALSFFLTVSWTTSPYYYGADIVFLFAWTPFAAVGAAGVLSLDGLVAARRSAPGTSTASGAVVERRTLAGAAVGAACLAGLTVVLGRVFGGTAGSSNASAGGRTARGGSAARPTPTSSGAAQAPSPQATGSRPPAGMHPVVDAGGVAVGHGVRFSDPATGHPAWLIRSSPHQYDAFSAVCTHAGCTVDYDASAKQFVCPCHGGTYSVTDGQVTGGPPPSPLARIKVALSGKKVYVR